MTAKQKLELSWSKNEKSSRMEPRVRFDLADEPQSEESPVRSYYGFADVCGRPRCSCTNIRFRCLETGGDTLMTSSNPVSEFWFDLTGNTISMTPQLEKEPESLRISGAFQAGFSEADRQSLREWFFAEKLEIIHNTPPGEMDFTDLPDADGGKMIGFVEVFPCGLTTNFSLNNEIWAVDEQFCVQSGCSCKETVLSFLKLVDATGRKSTEIRHSPAVRYNYATQISSLAARGPEGSPSPDLLLETIKREHPSFDAQLKLHHSIMQNVYLRRDVELSRLRSPAPKPASVAPKTGRNEPCPCGSGRKYKQCCLNKPQP
jgi:hypothetical protein